MGGTRGIGRAIADALKSSGHRVTAAGRNHIDTSEPDSVKQFVAANHTTDILVLNTGGPPPKTYTEVTDQEWSKYHNQLFTGMVAILRDIRVRDGGYIFLISSSVVKEPNPRLAISCAYRAAFSEIFKLAGQELAARQITCINIAPGLIATDRTRQILDKMHVNPADLPMGRMGEPNEIGEFVAGIVNKNIKYLSGVTILFDGAASTHIF